MIIINYCSDKLEIERFEIKPGESWCLYGSNISGINEFVGLFASHDFLSGVSPNERAVVISFAKQQEIFEEELKKDDSDFLDCIDPGTPAHDFIYNIDEYGDLIRAFDLDDCMEKGYRQLSSGESRKLILLSELSKNPGLLLFENPYDGVDSKGCRELDHTLSGLSQQGLKLIITVNNPEDIPPWCSHLGVIENGRLTHHGPYSEIIDQVQAFNSTGKVSTFSYTTPNRPTKQTESELISLKNGFARYGESEIFSNLQFEVKSGQHTLITGPNGSGKSTLLQIITGDNQNCYGNDLLLFGIKRGSGESIWEIKKHMGIVSPDLHRNYYIPGSAFQVVLSGFFDSIGVYKQFSKSQQEEAVRWLDMIGLGENVQTPFRQLSYARQRLCLIARSLIKMPRILILDEPTQGLDHHNRNALLDFLESIAKEKVSTIIYASHRKDEFRPFFKQHLDLTHI